MLLFLHFSVTGTNKLIMGLPELWEAWEVKCLLLSSLVMQLLMLILTELLRHVSGWPLLSAALSAILWLLYQTADDVAIYVLGHMSLSSRPREEQQLMAFWASLLLVHLGGQDTVTAYAMEDNDQAGYKELRGLNGSIRHGCIFAGVPR
jgi:choline-glycine betaine transporter